MFTLRIWDLPTRLFHWALAACVMGLIITGKLGGNAMVWHFRFGYGVLVLLAFRFFWGFWGGYWSRWSQLPLSPSQVWLYLRGHTAEHAFPGHNPLGSLSILGMLLVLALQVSTGLVSDDEIANAGPLTTLVPGVWIAWATSWHKQWGQWLVLFLLVLHLSALIWYRFRKDQSLLPAMVHGRKSLTTAVPESQDRLTQRFFALVLLTIASAGLWALLSLGT